MPNYFSVGFLCRHPSEQCSGNSHLGRVIIAFMQLLFFLTLLVMVSGIILSNNGISGNANGIADRVLNVDTGIWYPTIQSAISAPSTANGHTLSVTVGTYNENIIITKSLTIIGVDAASTIIDGNKLDRVINISAEANVTISNVTVQNGVVYGQDGGGIYNQGTLTLVDGHVSSNWANGTLGGGGICNTGVLGVINSTVIGNESAGIFWNIGIGIANSGILTVTNSTISNNTETSSSHVGGSIYNTGVATVLGTTLSNNGCAGIWNHIGSTMTLVDSTVSHNDGLDVGGIYNQGTMTVAHSIVKGNSVATYGSKPFGEAGGILNHSVLSVVSSTISSNSTCETGGGVYNDGTLVMSNSTVDHNEHLCFPSSSGGGIANTGTLAITNSTLSHNTSDVGSGLFVNSGAVSLNGITVAYNISAQSGGGIFQSAGTIEMQNTIVARNVGGQSPDCKGTVVSLGYNLLGNNTGCIFTPTSGDIVGTSGTPVDPLLGPLGNYGGPNLTVGLIPGSLAIDAGNPATCLSTDQRGFVRQGTCDIGSYEFGIGPGVSLTYLPTVLK